MEYYVYLHIKADTGEPFYVGKGKGNRAYRQDYRSEWWNKTVNKHGLDIIFLEENLDEQTVLELEVYWIKRIGRRDLGLGLLVNLTDGGEGVLNRIYKTSEQTKQKLSKAHKGKKKSKQAIEKLSKRMIGNKYRLNTKQSQEWKDEKSCLMKGENNHFYGKKHDDSKKTKIQIDGVIYDSYYEALRKLNMTYNMIRGRVNSNSDKFKNYIKL